MGGYKLAVMFTGVIYTTTAREMNRKEETPRSPENDPVVSPPSNEQKRRGCPEKLSRDTWYRADWGVGEKSVGIRRGGRYAVKANW